MAPPWKGGEFRLTGVRIPHSPIFYMWQLHMHMNQRFLYVVALVLVVVSFVIGDRVIDRVNEARSVPIEMPARDDAANRGYADVIRVISPQPYEVVVSPMIVRGEARGQWFFEATFPVTIVNWDGLIIGEGYAEALSDWMVEDFVPFEARVLFDTSPELHTYPRGTLLLHKSNPSGLPAYDAVLDIPLEFAQ